MGGEVDFKGHGPNGPAPVQLFLKYPFQTQSEKIGSFQLDILAC